MDKKIKKRIDVLRSNLQRLRQQLAGAQKQSDDIADAYETDCVDPLQDFQFRRQWRISGLLFGSFGNHAPKKCERQAK